MPHFQDVIAHVNLSGRTDRSETLLPDNNYTFVPPSAVELALVADIASTVAKVTRRKVSRKHRTSARRKAA